METWVANEAFLPSLKKAVNRLDRWRKFKASNEEYLALLAEHEAAQPVAKKSRKAMATRGSNDQTDTESVATEPPAVKGRVEVRLPLAE